jgi:hypothetical protein
LPSAGAIGVVLVLRLLCTAIAFVVFSILIAEAGTSRATVITYVNPSRTATSAPRATISPPERQRPQRDRAPVHLVTASLCCRLTARK